MEVDRASREPWFKRALAAAGLLLALPGIPLVFGFVCLTMALLIEDDQAAVPVGLTTFVLTLITLGAGGLVFWESLQSLRGVPSKSMRWPPAWLLAGIFGLLVVLGWFIETTSFATALLFPPVLVVAAALPPLVAISWFAGQKEDSLTWRRGLLALAGGATVSVFLAMVLEILFPLVVLTLVFDLAEIVLSEVEELLAALAGQDVANAMTNPGFIYIFLQVALIAPIAEELAKPLAILPVLRRLTRPHAFLIGAMAGAGFAALENTLYAAFGLPFWAGILLVRALGGAIHPLGAGLVSQGWHGVLKGEAGAWSGWFIRFALAAGLHALWNGGSLIVITLASAQFFGQLPPAVNVLGLSAAGTTLALLIVLGVVGLWLGRRFASNLAGTEEAAQGDAGQFILSNRALAMWALACLVAVVPMGIAGLQVLLG
jgi:RsiW-degrading membrane proteinase PrsW (M82 family)